MVAGLVDLAQNDDDSDDERIIRCSNGDEVKASDEETIHRMFTYKFWLHSTKVAVITK